MPDSVTTNEASLDMVSPDGSFPVDLVPEAEYVAKEVDLDPDVNGKGYFQRSIAGNKAEYDDLLVPPGLQEFRVAAQKNGVEKSSNTVSMEFMAKKKKTLKVELRVQGQSAPRAYPRTRTRTPIW